MFIQQINVWSYTTAIYIFIFYIYLFYIIIIYLKWKNSPLKSNERKEKFKTAVTEILR